MSTGHHVRVDTHSSWYYYAIILLKNSLQFFYETIFQDFKN